MRGRAWGSKEDALLRASVGKPDEEIRDILAAAGYPRTVHAIDSYRTKHKLPGARETRVWTDQEREIVAANPTAKPAEIVAALAAEGFDRTVGAIWGMRHKLGVCATEVPEYRARLTEERRRYLDRARQVIAGVGWPVLRGSPEDRDRQHVRNLLTAMLEAERARTAKEAA